MLVTLANFDEEIDFDIARRGRTYYRKKAVKELKLVADNKWTATVQGHDIYSVQITCENGLVTHCNCDCPYDFGPYCKHEVAVLYSLRDGVKKTRPRKQAQYKSFSQPTSNNEVEEKVDIKHRIMQALREYSGRDRFIEYAYAGDASLAVDQILYEADKLIDEQKTDLAIPYYQSAIEVLVPALQRVDDSDGGFGSAIDNSFERLEQITPLLNQSIANDFLQYCLKESLHKRYNGWSEFQNRWLIIAGKLCVSERDKQDVFGALDQLTTQDKSADSDFFATHHLEEIILIKNTIIKRMNGVDASIVFLRSNMKYSKVKKELVDQYIVLGDYDQAKELANSAFVEYYSSHAFIAMDFAQQLVQIAELQQDQANILKWTQVVFLGLGDFDYYHKLKKVATAKEWQAILVQLLSLTGRRSPYPRAGVEVQARIFALEGMLKELFALANSDSSCYYLVHEYENILKKLYPEGIADIYEREVRFELQAAVLGRRVYQQACRKLRRIKKLGFESRVNNIATDLMAQYPRRTALLEELGNL